MNAHNGNKLTPAEKAKYETDRNGTFTPLRHGGVLLRYQTTSKILDGDAAAAFLKKIRDKGAGYVRKVVRSYFTPSAEAKA